MPLMAFAMLFANSSSKPGSSSIAGCFIFVSLIHCRSHRVASPGKAGLWLNNRREDRHTADPRPEPAQNERFMILPFDADSA